MYFIPQMFFFLVFYPTVLSSIESGKERELHNANALGAAHTESEANFSDMNMVTLMDLDVNQKNWLAAEYTREPLKEVFEEVFVETRHYHHMI